MKFSYIATVLSVLLATTFASPIGEPQSADTALEIRASPEISGLESRAPTTEHSNYDAISKLTTQVGWHAFSLAWDKVEVKDDPDMKSLTEQIGGSHIAILVGEVKADKTFTGTYYHIIYDGPRPTPAKRDGYPIKMVNRPFDAKGKPEIKPQSLYGTPKITGGAVQATAQHVLGTHKYDIKSFNCKIYADQVWAAIK